MSGKAEQPLVDPPSYGESVGSTPRTSTSQTRQNQASSHQQQPASSSAFGHGGATHMQQQSQQQQYNYSSGDKGRDSKLFADYNDEAATPPAGKKAASKDKGKGKAKEREASRIPVEAQKALAPLNMSNDLKDIVGMYSLELSSQTTWTMNGSASTLVTPCCNFAATGKNDIDVTLYFRPPPVSTSANAPPLPSRSTAHTVTPPLEILTSCKKGKLKLSVPDRLPGRPLRMVSSLEGNAYVSIPLGFDGKLAIWAPTGTVELSEQLRRQSTIIPSTTQNSYIIVYRITPPTSNATSADEAALPGGIMDLCQINTSKGRVKVDYAKAPGGDSCVIM